MDFRTILKLQLDEYDSELKRLVSDLTEQERREMPSETSHHIDFALWHASRAEDVLLNFGAKEADQLWEQDGWHERFDIAVRDVGVGYSADQVKEMPSTPIELLLGYHEACREQTLEYISYVDPAELDKRSPFEALHRQLPDITKGGILAHVVVETAQHLGQIGYIRGILRGINN